MRPAGSPGIPGGPSQPKRNLSLFAPPPGPSEPSCLQGAQCVRLFPSRGPTAHFQGAKIDTWSFGGPALFCPSPPYVGPRSLKTRDFPTALSHALILETRGRVNPIHECSVALAKPRLDAAKLRTEGGEETQGFLFLKASLSNGIHKIEKKKK